MFSRRGKRHQPWCKECSTAAFKEYYSRNIVSHKQEVAERLAEIRRINSDWLSEMKNAPCSDCGKKYPPYAMDFDHVRGEKIHNISNLVNSASTIEQIKVEIEKCELVCANCHRIRTYKRGYNAE